MKLPEEIKEFWMKTAEIVINHDNDSKVTTHNTITSETGTYLLELSVQQIKKRKAQW